MVKDSKTEQKILEAAKKIFQKKGMGATRMQEIADEAGINKSLLHYYFRSKDKLYATIFQQIFNRFIPNMMELFAGEKPLEVKIWTFVDNYIRMLRQNPYLVLFIMNELNQNPERIIDMGGFKRYVKKEILQQQIDKEAERGNIIAIDALDLFINLIALSAFPFIAKPMICSIFDLDENEFNSFIEKRKKDIPQLIMKWIKHKD